MPLVSKIIPGFFGGVSQQSPALREDTQCEALTNGLTTMEYGLCMRPNTSYIATLYDGYQADLFTHVINRDSSEKYLVFIDTDDTDPIKVFKLDGTQCTVRYGILDADLAYTEDQSVLDYVNSATPKATFKATTIADYTIIVNKDIAPSMDTTLTPTQSPSAYAYVVQGGPGVTYKIYIDDAEEASYTTGLTDASTYTTDVVCTNLLNQLMTNLGGEITEVVSTATETQTVTTTFTLTQDCTVNWSIVDRDGASHKFWIKDAESNNLVYWIPGMQTYGSIWLTIGTYTVITQSSNGWSKLDRIITKVTYPTSGSWMIQRIGNTIAIQRQDSLDFAFKCVDGQGDTYMKGIKDTVQKFQDLPPNVIDGTVITVAGNADNLFSSYYVRYESVANQQNGIWTETIKPGIPFRFNSTTMPHRLVRTGTNQFTFAPILWEDRKVGNELTAPNPSFIGKAINDIFFHKNRLGFLSGENTVFSKAGEFFNYWPGTGMEVLDDDPIDIGVTSTQVNILYNAISFNKGLLVFSNQEQFVSTSGEQLFTPKTAAFLGTTKYHTNTDCRPIGVGSMVYFAVPSGSYTQIREYAVQPNSLIDDAIDITAHVPEYIPCNLKTMAIAPAKNILFCYSSEEPTTLYVYKYMWSNQQKVQSSWSKWTFDTLIADIMVIDNALYLVVAERGKSVLLKMDLERLKSGDLSFRVHLDKLAVVQGTYDGNTFTTSWTLPYDSSTLAIAVVKSDDGLSIPDAVKSESTPTLVTAPGDYSAVPCFIGVPYIMRYRFSEWFVRDRTTGIADTLNRLQIRTLTVTFSNTTSFHLEVKPNRNQAMSVYPFTGFILGQSQLGSPNLIADRETFLTMCSSKGTVIELVNDSYLPCELQTATFEGLYTIRARVL